MAQSAPVISFDEIIQAGTLRSAFQPCPALTKYPDRIKRKNEALAEQLLGSGRRKATSGAGTLASRRGAPPTAPSLASRIGITKVRRLFRYARRMPKTFLQRASPKPHADGPWANVPQHPSKATRPALTARTQSAGNMRRTKMYVDAAGDAPKSAGPRPASAAPISIRGIAHTGPYVVLGTNFAPGTTAADIKAAMAPYGEVIDCYLTSVRPSPVAEIIFKDLKTADTVIEVFHGQKVCAIILLQSFVNVTRRTGVSSMS